MCISAKDAVGASDPCRQESVRYEAGKSQFLKLGWAWVVLGEQAERKVLN